MNANEKCQEMNKIKHRIHYIKELLRIHVSPTFRKVFRSN